MITAGESCVGTSTSGAASLTGVADDCGNSSRFMGRFVTGFPGTGGLFAGSGRWFVLQLEALSGRGDRGVVGLSCGFGFGTIGAGCIIGDAGSDGGFLFTCQSSESSSAKKLSDI